MLDAENKSGVLKGKYCFRIQGGSLTASAILILESSNTITDNDCLIILLFPEHTEIVRLRMSRLWNPK